MFINTVLEDSNTIINAGWYSMSDVQPETFNGFKENGTKLTNGAAVNTSQRKGHILSKKDAESVKIVNYMNNWNPTYI